MLQDTCYSKERRAPQEVSKEAPKGAAGGKVKSDRLLVLPLSAPLSWPHLAPKEAAGGIKRRAEEAARLLVCESEGMDDLWKSYASKKPIKLSCHQIITAARLSL